MNLYNLAFIQRLAETATSAAEFNQRAADIGLRVEDWFDGDGELVVFVATPTAQTCDVDMRMTRDDDGTVKVWQNLRRGLFVTQDVDGTQSITLATVIRAENRQRLLDQFTAALDAVATWNVLLEEYFYVGEGTDIVTDEQRLMAIAQTINEGVQRSYEIMTHVVAAWKIDSTKTTIPSYPQSTSVLSVDAQGNVSSRNPQLNGMVISPDHLEQLLLNGIETMKRLDLLTPVR